MDWIRQKDWSGCGIAAIAMLTDRSYVEARSFVEICLGWTTRNWASHGLNLSEVETVLIEDGWTLDYRAAVAAPWPPAPWAERHLGYNEMHYVAIEADGRVLDTHWEGRLKTMLSDWPELEVVVGLSR